MTWVQHKDIIDMESAGTKQNDCEIGAVVP